MKIKYHIPTSLYPILDQIVPYIALSGLILTLIGITANAYVENGNDASGDYSDALGVANYARAMFSTVLGVYNEANGYASTVIGSHSYAWGRYSSVFGGTNNNVTGYASIAVGDALFVSGDHSHAVGYASGVKGKESNVIGNFVSVDGNNSVVIGIKPVVYMRDNYFASSGNFEIIRNGDGIVLHSKNGNEFCVTVSDSGVLETSKGICQ